ncbi:AAA family ATPase [Pseudomonas corrugata]
MRRKGFTLLEFRDDDFELPLFAGEADTAGTVVSVLIGPNGCGKSRALSRVIDEFVYLASLRNKRKTGRTSRRSTSGKCFIRYQIGGIECTISRDDSVVSCTTEQEYVELKYLPFPAQIAAVAHLPADKFRFSKEGSNVFYKYLGLRQSTNLTTTGALEAKVVQSLFHGLDKPGFKDNLKRWLSLAGYTSDLYLLIAPYSEKMLSTKFDEVEEAILYRQPTGVIPDSLDERAVVAFDFFQKMKTLPVIHDSFALSIMELSNSDLDMWRYGYDTVRRLRSFGSVSLVFMRGKEALQACPFSDLSSGEQQIIGTHSRLLAEVEENSLVVIDEPELSLHPDWQMEYIPTLKSCLEKIKGVHVLIATHSHFMVSDIDDKNSSLIMAKKRNASFGWNFELFDGDVYGRSPENILYRAFGVATSGNIYVEKDLRDALHMISMEDDYDKNKLYLIFDRLQQVNGPDNPAMNILLERIGKFIERNQ